MYTQFFGNYLLSKGYVTSEQLFRAMQKKADERMRLGTLAIHSGYMSASEVDMVIIEQTHADKKFGELAVELGYLTEDQVKELLHSQSPDFLLLGQILVDDGVLTNNEFERIIAEYRIDNEFFELDMYEENAEHIQRMFDNFFLLSEEPITDTTKMYIELLFNNFVRFIGEDFTPLLPEQITEYVSECCICQRIYGSYKANAYLCMDTSTAIAFASRYVNDLFTEYDEYVQASLEDFLNLHNGLFTVNASNENSVELSISPPESIEDPIITFSANTYHLPILYPFGTVHFMYEIIEES